MDSATQGLPGVYVYLDDVLVASKSEVEHLRQLRALCSALRKFGLVVNEQKCVFGKSKVEFLGNEVSAAGISPAVLAQRIGEDELQPLAFSVDALQQPKQNTVCMTWNFSLSTQPSSISVTCWKDERCANSPIRNL